MILLRFSVTNYKYFSAIKHRKVSTASLFNVLYGQTKSLQEYLTHFNEETIKVASPNQEMFVGDFQNGLKVGHFNMSLDHKLTSTLDEIMTHAECYNKGEKSNAKKEQWMQMRRDYKNKNGWVKKTARSRECTRKNNIQTQSKVI